MPTETIAEKLIKINQIKAGLKTQIEAKGVTVGDSSFEEYPGLVEDIQQSQQSNKFKSVTDGSITTVTLEDLAGLTAIRNNAFRGCDYIVSVDIPNSVTRIGNNAFYNLRLLTHLSVGNGVSTIGYQAFQYCSAITSIDLPASVTSIDYGAFQYCTGLAQFIIRATTPPTLTNVNAIESNTSIFVPYSADHSILNAYKSATNWSVLANRIFEIQE